MPFSQARHPQGLYSAVETGRTFFSLPSGIFTFLPPSLAKPRHLGCRWRRQVERVRRDQVERRPLPHFARLQAESDQIDIIILILPGVVDGRASIETSEPGIGRAVIERADKGSIMWQRAGKREKPLTNSPERPNSFANRGRLKLKPREIGAVEGKGKSPKIATTKDGGIQNIDPFVINTFHNSASEI